MQLVTIKIKGLVVTSRYGALSTGDLLRTDPEYAKHLVEECCAGEYVTTPAQPAEKPKRSKQSKAQPVSDTADVAEQDADTEAPADPASAE